MTIGPGWTRIGRSLESELLPLLLLLSLLSLRLRRRGRERSLLLLLLCLLTGIGTTAGSMSNIGERSGG